MTTQSPPDLRVLYRKLKSIDAAQLPRALPSLVGHVVRCREALSTPYDPKLKDDAPEGAQLVHKLKTIVTRLLTDRSREARFTAIALVKAIVDVGGWEAVRGSSPWIQGLLAIIQKSDPSAAKELAVVTLTKIYLLVHPYQTLVREIATPTLPELVRSCIQNVKALAQQPGSLASSSLQLIETTCHCFSTLIPLYPTIFRNSASQIRTTVRPYLAPTSADPSVIPASVSASARRLLISLPQVAAKSGGTDEWAKLTTDVLKELHITGDQVLRAVDESWEPSSSYTKSAVDFGVEPSSTSPSPLEFPPWTGLDNGAQRLVGLFRYLSDCVACSTKVAVIGPVYSLLDAAFRVFLIARLSPKTQTWDQSLQTSASVGREEKDELWALMPNIHIAALGLVQALFERLEDEMVPVIPEVLDHLVRVSYSGIDIPGIRLATYSLASCILTTAGPTLSQPAVDSLAQVIRAVCRELQEDAGVLKSKPAPMTKDIKNGAVAGNADAFLQTRVESQGDSNALLAEHKAAASKFLVLTLDRLPQRHLRLNLRILIDRTAILIRSRDAMVASVLNPYQDKSGRNYPSILPHLTREFPTDQEVEILRTNLRADVPRLGGDTISLTDVDELDEEVVEGDTGDQEAEALGNGVLASTAVDPWQPPTVAAAPPIETTLPIQNSASAASMADAPTTYGAFGDIQSVTSPPKRKLEAEEDGVEVPVKRLVVEKSSPRATRSTTAAAAAIEQAAEGVDDDDDSDESVHLNMELEDEDEDEDGEE